MAVISVDNVKQLRVPNQIDPEYEVYKKKVGFFLNFYKLLRYGRPF